MDGVIKTAAEFGYDSLRAFWSNIHRSCLLPSSAYTMIGCAFQEECFKHLLKTYLFAGCVDLLAQVRSGIGCLVTMRFIN